MKHLKDAFVIFLIIAVAISIGACSTIKSDKYNTDQYPDSLILELFEKQGINPEMFADRLLKMVEYEILTGKFTRATAIDKLEKMIFMIESMPPKYNLIAELFNLYYGEIMNDMAGELSDTVMLMYILVQPDLPALNIDVPVSQDDLKLIKQFINFLGRNLSINWSESKNSEPEDGFLYSVNSYYEFMTDKGV